MRDCFLGQVATVTMPPAALKVPQRARMPQLPDRELGDRQRRADQHEQLGPGTATPSFMRDLMETHADDSPVTEDLVEVFHLPA